MTQLLRFVTRTQLVRFRHGLKSSLTTSIPRSQTVTLPQFSTKTSATRLRDRSPANEAQPTAFTPPTVGGEQFINIRDLNTESLSDSVVQIDQPLEADTVGTAAAAAAAVAAAAAAAAAAAPPAPETSVGLDRHPVALPEELSSNVIHLSCESTAEGGVCDVYLVGTVHDTQESCRQVRAIVDFLKPEAVFLELCRSRVAVLTEKNVEVEFHPGGSDGGSEFAVAYEEVIKYGGRVILGDRPVEILMQLISSQCRHVESFWDSAAIGNILMQLISSQCRHVESFWDSAAIGNITIWRAWRQLPLWSKTKALFSVWFPTVFLSSSHDLNEMEMDDSAAAPIFCKKYPTLTEAFVHERDQYMSSKLLKVASESRSVVAVVGMGHLPGIKRNWKQPVVLEDLMTVPSPISATSILASTAPGGVFIIWMYLKYLKCKK